MTSPLKSASVYLRRAVYYIHPLAGSGGGDPSLLVAPVITLGQVVASSVLGEAVQRALDLSHHHAPWPTDWKHVSDPLFQAAGVKALSTFMNGTTNVRVDLVARNVSVLPTTSKQHRNAFAPLMDRIIRLHLGDPDELGLAVTRALAVSD